MWANSASKSTDTNVQCAALIVMQELVLRGEKTAEIFDIVGLTYRPGDLTNKQRPAPKKVLNDVYVSDLGGRR